VRGEAEAKGFATAGRPGLLAEGVVGLRMTGKPRTLHIVRADGSRGRRRFGLTLTPQMPLLIRAG
jgi:hypothetical protein